MPAKCPDPTNPLNPLPNLRDQLDELGIALVSTFELGERNLNNFWAVFKFSTDPPNPRCLNNIWFLFPSITQKKNLMCSKPADSYLGNQFLVLLTLTLTKWLVELSCSGDGFQRSPVSFYASRDYHGKTAEMDGHIFMKWNEILLRVNFRNLPWDFFSNII